MKCPCGGNTVVTQTRARDNTLKRTRKCNLCNQAFYTTEVFLDWAVGKPGPKTQDKNLFSPTPEEVAKANKKKVEARRKLEDKRAEKEDH